MGKPCFAKPLMLKVLSVKAQLCLIHSYHHFQLELGTCSKPGAKRRQGSSDLRGWRDFLSLSQNFSHLAVGFDTGVQHSNPSLIPGLWRHSHSLSWFSFFFTVFDNKFCLMVPQANCLLTLLKWFLMVHFSRSLHSDLFHIKMHFSDMCNSLLAWLESLVSVLLRICVYVCEGIGDRIYLILRMGEKN